MHCRVRYLFHLDLKICSVQVCGRFGRCCTIYRLSNYARVTLSDFMFLSSVNSKIANAGKSFGNQELLSTSLPVDLYWFFEISIRTDKKFQFEITSLRISKFHFSSNLSFSFRKLRQSNTIFFNKYLFSGKKVFLCLCFVLV